MMDTIFIYQIFIAIQAIMAAEAATCAAERGPS
jgi:hypothetical protein